MMKLNKAKLEILHKDEAIIIINKPPFLLSIPDRWKPEIPSVAGEMQKKFEEVFVVHRLDKETSGIICMARTREAHRNLSLQFENRTIDKKYLVLLDGTGLAESGKIESSIAPHPSKPGKMRISPKGKPSLTEYRLLETFNRFSLAEATIKTGRTHQIRVHFESIGFPLAIDRVYGRRESLSVTDIKMKKIRLGKLHEAPKPLMARSSLHAWKLELKHPVTNKRIRFESEPPKDFRAVLNQLRKWG